jgi:hypothetical protein
MEPWMPCDGNVAELLDHPNFLNKPSCTQHDPGEFLFGEKVALQLFFFITYCIWDWILNL